MIITTHKQFPNYKRYEIEYEGRPLVMETGKLAEPVQLRRPRQLRRDDRARHLHGFRPPEGRCGLLPAVRRLQ